MFNIREKIKKSRHLIDEADAVVILAGAGMGVDSGLPDFRGKEGFWKAYPMLKEKEQAFYDMANPETFYSDPALAWGFYGHRLNLYRDTVPHKGFQILKKLVESKPDGYFIYTSNVDGQFQKAGFDTNRIVECHGSIHHLQNVSGKGGVISADDFDIEVDEGSLRAKSLLLHPDTGELLRPNILMFNDGTWVRSRFQNQLDRYHDFIKGLAGGQKVVLIELGAGTAIPTVRIESSYLRNRLCCPYIQINPELRLDCDIGIEKGALEALTAIMSDEPSSTS